MKNSFYRCFSIIILFFAFVSAPLAAKKSDSPYNGLLPPKHKVEISETQITYADISGKKIALIPSKRYIEHVAWFKKRLSNGKFYGSNLDPETYKSVEIAIDPRRILDAIIPLLQQSGAEVEIHDDLRSATSSGSDVFMVIDYSGKQKANVAAFLPLFGLEGNTHDFHSEGGVYCLDRSLRQICEAKSKTKVSIDQKSMFGSFDEAALKYATAAAKAQQSFIDALIVDIGSKMLAQ